MTTRIALAAAPILGAVFGLFFAGAVQAEAPAVTVKATDELEFVPGKVVVSAGDTVRWKNTSVLVHTVTDVPGKAADKADVALPDGAEPFNSGRLSPGAGYEHRFTVPGTYIYFCIPHEAAGMVGTVVVKPKE